MPVSSCHQYPSVPHMGQALSRHCHTLFLEGVPRMNLNTRDQVRAQSQCGCGKSFVPVQMWHGVGPISVQMWHGVGPISVRMWHGVGPVLRWRVWVMQPCQHACVHLCACVCMFVRACVCLCLHARAFVRVRVRARVRGYVSLYASVHACARGVVHVCVRARVCATVSECAVCTHLRRRVGSSCSSTSSTNTGRGWSSLRRLRCVPHY